MLEKYFNWIKYLEVMRFIFSEENYYKFKNSAILKKRQNK